jgi:hypothetical protein
MAPEMTDDAATCLAPMFSMAHLARAKRHGIGKFNLWDHPYLEIKYWMSGRRQNAHDYAHRLLAAEEYRLRVRAERAFRKS